VSEVNQLLAAILDRCGEVCEENCPKAWVTLARRLEAERDALREYKKAIDDALIVGPQTTVDAFPSVKAALHHLIGWEVKVYAEQLRDAIKAAKGEASSSANG
jgi:hypothetical protein